MRYRTHLVLLLILFVSAACSYIPFSAGGLTGKVVEAPDNWTKIAQVDIAQLETQPADPYSVNLWIIGRGSNLYVYAGDNRSTWVEHIEVNPNVRLQIEDTVYLLTAQRVTDAAEFERFAQAWDTKYGNRPGNENVAETYLMRLIPRVD